MDKLVQLEKTPIVIVATLGKFMLVNLVHLAKAALLIAVANGKLIDDKLLQL